MSVAVKAANEQLMKGIAKEEGKHGIRANSVLVGVIDAGQMQTLTALGQLDAQWVEETHKLLCLKRWGTPAEIGHAAIDAGAGANGGTDANLRARLEMLEARLIVEAMKRHGGNKTRVADELGLSRMGLRAKIARYGLEGATGGDA